MSNFNEKDVEKLEKWGNANAKKYWLAGHNKTLYPIPERRDLSKMKEFMRMKYVQKRFLEEEDASDDDSDNSSDEERKKKSKKKKKAKKVKKSKKKKKKHHSSDDDSDESNDSDDEENKNTKPEKPLKTKFKPAQKVSSKLGKPKATNKKAQEKPKPKQKEEEIDIFGLGLDSDPAPAATGGDDNGWATFESGTPQEKPSQKKDDPNELWGAFDTPTQNQK